MIVSELIEFLKTQDQGATVEVVGHKLGGGYYNQGGEAYKVDFDPLKHVEYIDLRGNPFVTIENPSYERRYLFLGQLDA